MSSEPSPSRRGFLKGLAGLGSTGLAGCLRLPPDPSNSPGRPGGGTGGAGGGDVTVPDDATIVSINASGTITGETSDGAQYTGSSLHTVVQDISSDVDGAIAIQPGTYPWTGMATLSNNTHIMGDGAVSIEAQSLNNVPMLDLYDATNDITVQNIIFNSDGTSGGAVSRREGRVPRKDNILVRGCEFHDFLTVESEYEGNHIVNADNWYNSVIEDCFFTNVGYSAIRLHAGGEGMICRGNTIDLPPDAQQAIMSDANQSLIEDNRITLGDASGDPSHAIHLRDLWAEFGKDITIRNNTVVADAESTDSIGVSVETHRVDPLVIDGNTFTNLNQGVSGELQAGTDITLNEFNSCRVGISSSDSSDINRADNVFIECETDVLL